MPGLLAEGGLPPCRRGCTSTACARSRWAGGLADTSWTPGHQHRLLAAVRIRIWFVADGASAGLHLLRRAVHRHRYCDLVDLSRTRLTGELVTASVGTVVVRDGHGRWCPRRAPSQVCGPECAAVSYTPPACDDQAGARLVASRSRARRSGGTPMRVGAADTGDALPAARPSGWFSSPASRSHTLRTRTLPSPGTAASCPSDADQVSWVVGDCTSGANALLSGHNSCVGDVYRP